MKSITLILMIIFLGFISNACTFYPIWDDTDLKLYDKDFSDIYSERKEVVDFPTAGFYYRLDSMYIHRFHDDWIIDIEKRPPFERYYNENIAEKPDSFKVYWLDFFWILKDGTFFYPRGKSANYDSPYKQFGLESSPGADLGLVSGLLLDSIQGFYKSVFPKKNEGYEGKGVMQFYNRQYGKYCGYSLKFYLLNVHFEMGASLGLIFGSSLADSTVLIYKETYGRLEPARPDSMLYCPKERNIEKLSYKFHPSEVIPSEDYMQFGRYKLSWYIWRFLY